MQLETNPFAMATGEETHGFPSEDQGQHMISKMLG
jgi:hypothetical protein